MNIERLQLTNYRNYESLTLDFSSKINVFIGENAQGKTNVMESLYVLAMAKSHRTSNGKYLAVAEKNKQKLYLISETKKLWEINSDEAISRVSVNENGYVSIVCSGTTYKSIIVVYNQSGDQMFKTYIPKSTVVDSTISSDNRYLSYVEIDTSKTLIQSVVKTISMKDAANSSDSTNIYTYNMPTNEMVINIKYQGSKNLVCISNSRICVLSDGKIQGLLNFEDKDKNYTFAGIELANTIYGYFCNWFKRWHSRDLC